MRIVGVQRFSAGSVHPANGPHIRAGVEVAAADGATEKRVIADLFDVTAGHLQRLGMVVESEGRNWCSSRNPRAVRVGRDIVPVTEGIRNRGRGIEGGR